MSNSYQDRRALSLREPHDFRRQQDRNHVGNFGRPRNDADQERHEDRQTTFRRPTRPDQREDMDHNQPESSRNVGHRNLYRPDNFAHHRDATDHSPDRNHGNDRKRPRHSTENPDFRDSRVPSNARHNQNQDTWQRDQNRNGTQGRANNHSPPRRRSRSPPGRTWFQDPRQPGRDSHTNHLPQRMNDNRHMPNREPIDFRRPINFNELDRQPLPRRPDDYRQPQNNVSNRLYTQGRHDMDRPNLPRQPVSGPIDYSHSRENQASLPVNPISNQLPEGNVRPVNGPKNGNMARNQNQTQNQNGRKQNNNNSNREAKANQKVGPGPSAKKVQKNPQPKKGQKAKNEKVLAEPLLEPGSTMSGVEGSRDGTILPSFVDDALQNPGDVVDVTVQEAQAIPETEAPQIPVKVKAPPFYTVLSQVGEGTYGKVYKALTGDASGRLVALKRIKLEGEKDGFPVTAMREIKLLQALDHPNVVKLWEIMIHRQAVHMVFEYMDHDLTGLLTQKTMVLTEAHIKSLALQMFSGLDYLHERGILHRDLKGPNILLNSEGDLKIADFGLARLYHKHREADYTNRVITLWYRPIELLFGATIYGAEVDVWSAGCIFLEMFVKRPVFQGNDEIHQIEILFDLCGTPEAHDYPGIMMLPWFDLLRPKSGQVNQLRTKLAKYVPAGAMDVAEALLMYDPAQRITAAAAMQMAYFNSEPLPQKPVQLSELKQEWHEFEVKAERARRKRSQTEQLTSRTTQLSC